MEKRFTPAIILTVLCLYASSTGVAQDLFPRKNLSFAKPLLNLEGLAGIQPPVTVEDTMGYYENVLTIDDAMGITEQDALLGMVNLDSLRFGYDYVPDVSYETVGERLALLETTIPLTYNSYVKGFVDYFTVRNREYTKKVLRRKDVYFPLFERYLAKYNLPDELKYLSIVESGLNTRAISRAGAAGLWQFMPFTGRIYKLHQDWYVDERLDPEKATEAACKYLKELYQIFGDWELALASYNAGPGNVRKAIRRSGYKKTFWEIYRYLPRETRSYVPQFVAVIYSLNYAIEHNLFIDDPDYLMACDTVRVDGYLHLPTMANLLGVCPEDLEDLNPQLKRSVVPETMKNYPVKIPADRLEFFALNKTYIIDSAARVGKAELEYLARHSIGSTYGRDKVVYRVRSGDVLGSIAQRYRVRVSDLRKWNNLNSNLIKVGQRLNIWVNGGNSSAVAQQSSSPGPIPDSKIHVVQPGDTLWHISRKYEGLSIEKIKKLNNLTDNKIKPGQKLVIG